MNLYTCKKHSCFFDFIIYTNLLTIVHYFSESNLRSSPLNLIPLNVR